MLDKRYKLQIIVPHFKEPQKLVSRLFDSLKMQQQIDFSDFEVILVNDGAETVFDSTFLSSYPFKIQYFIKPWEGPAAARQYGLDIATADYVMFCDSDDLFMRLTALWELFQVMEQKQPDIITSQFITFFETPTFNMFSPINKDDIWIHGKLWKTAYLKENKIEWPKNLPLCEDAYFVRLGLALTQNILNITNPFYYWTHRPDSYINSNFVSSTEAYLERMKSNETLVKKFLDLNRLDLAAKYTFIQVYESYFELQGSEWNFPENQETKKMVEKTYAEFIQNYDYLISHIDYQDTFNLINLLREQYYTQRNRVSLEDISFRDWKTYIVRTYITNPVN